MDYLFSSYYSGLRRIELVKKLYRMLTRKLITITSGTKEYMFKEDVSARIVCLTVARCLVNLPQIGILFVRDRKIKVLAPDSTLDIKMNFTPLHFPTVGDIVMGEDHELLVMKKPGFGNKPF